MSGYSRKAVFIDRDGTLIEDAGYLSRVEDLRIFPFSLSALRLLKTSGFLVVVVTNQSGVGRGFFDETTVNAIHERIRNDLEGMIDGFYFCPHVPGEGCACRKPNTAMIETACADLNIDLARSWMIGDKAIDVQTGRNAGVGTALVLTGYGMGERAELASQPDIVANDLLGAVNLIVK